MSKVMLVNVTHVEESRVAVLEDGVLAAYEIETLNRASLKGNIHNAVVESVHPSLEAAFVKIGPDLKGFLPIDEINFRLLPPRSDSRKMGRIGQHIHPGQKLMAQIVREPFAGKPPSISTYFSLPGRYLVLMPGVDSSGISRKIDSAGQRERLKKIVDELNPPEGFGLIVRTAGLGQTKTELQRDLRYLLRLWESVQGASKAGEFPSLVYREADLVIRTIRDYFTSDISEVWIDSEETYEKALKFVRSVMPSRAKTLKLYSGDRPLFNKFNLEEQIERIYKRRVPLPSGGEIVIDGTEALTAIDVNTARSKRHSDLEDSATQTNVEAATEIARQLRLRDLGGLVVIDFIDMQQMRNRKKVEKSIRDAMRGDRAKHDLTTISKLGLMELARQRIKGAKMASSYATCPNCDGHGLIKNVETAALWLLRKLQSRCSRGDAEKMHVSMPPEVATWLMNNKRVELTRLEQRHRMSIEINPDPGLLRHESQFTLTPRSRQEPGEIVAPASAEAASPTAASTIDDVIEPTPPPAAAEAPTGRRRRGRKRRPSTAVAVAAGTNGDAQLDSAESAPAPEPRAVEAQQARPDDPNETGSDRSTAPEPAVDGKQQEPDGTLRPKRRRRGRRRSRPAAGAAEGQQTTEVKEPPPSKRDEVVPPNIRADELMPAASGGARRGKKPDGPRGGGSGSNRRGRRRPRN